jgi:hypothetical protein
MVVVVVIIVVVVFIHKHFFFNSILGGLKRGGKIDMFFCFDITLLLAVIFTFFFHLRNFF